MTREGAMNGIETNIRQALAQGYCSHENRLKVLDPTLIDAMAKDVYAMLKDMFPQELIAPPTTWCEHWQWIEPQRDQYGGWHSTDVEHRIVADWFKVCPICGTERPGGQDA